MIVSWLTDNDETMRALCMREQVPVSPPQGHDELAAALQPYIQEFVSGLIAGEVDVYLKGRSDTKKHFAAWLPKYRKAQQSSVPPSRHGSPPLTPEQAAEDQLKKRRRLEHAAEQQAQLDRQAADSQSSDAQAAAADFFRKHSINNKKR